MKLKSAHLRRAKVNTYNYLLFFALVVLCFVSTRTRFTALVLVCAYLLYSSLIVNFDGLMYYGSTATLNFIVFLCLSGVKGANSIVLMLAVVHIFINFGGWVMYEKYYQPDLYNAAALTASTLQVLALLIGLINARLDHNSTWVRMVCRVDTWCQKFHYEKRKQKAQA